ncbi:MAG: hypothetical protein KIT85_17210 [Pseudolabrys sp.]|nr:hypothetical protein [Pseudolabrys sp.]MCW5686138.1 hypothetical protein [Pseudolabrys sp.]
MIRVLLIATAVSLTATAAQAQLKPVTTLKQGQINSKSGIVAPRAQVAPSIKPGVGAGIVAGGAGNFKPGAGIVAGGAGNMRAR